MKRLWRYGKVNIVLLLLLAAVSVAACFRFPVSWAFAVSAASFAIAVLCITVSLLNLGKRQKKILTEVSKKLSSAESVALTELKIPVLILSAGETVWYNNAMSESLPSVESYIGKNISQLIGDKCSAELAASGVSEFVNNKHIFKIYASSVINASGNFTVCYLVDVTTEIRYRYKYEQSRPVVAIVAIDNLDELSYIKDSELSAFKSAVQTEIEKWVADSSAIVRRMTGDRYLMIFEERTYNHLIENKFDILESVKQIKSGDIATTLSIGVGRGGSNMSECEELAKQALDMALGRGGDQAAIKMPNNEFKFFGGVNASVQKRTRVRARLIASSLKELIDGSDRVILMGHSFSDLDSLGSCYALYSTVKQLGREAHLIIDRKKTMASSLLQRIETIDENFEVTDPKKLIPYITASTLLIILDTHRAAVLENKELFEACKNVVVIDHHRRSVDYINNAVIFYNEPAASSACEMVTELIQYINPKSLRQLQADALLSGIMLDTKNYVLRTGVRTFEASAFLRERGADPVVVKKLFSESMQCFKMRSQIVASAAVYGKYAIARADIGDDENVRMIAAQAADELLSINDISASFVMCKTGDCINISARSFGVVNVQVIMELLGGGGHRTMAACQIDTTDFSVAQNALTDAIKEFEEMQNTSNKKG